MSNAYDKKLGKNEHYKKFPTCLYFYYIRFKPDEMTYVAQQYFFDQHTRLHEDLENVIRRLVENVQGDNNFPPPFASTNEKPVRSDWSHRKCYLAFVIESANLELVDGDAITFCDEEGEEDTKSFSDAKQIGAAFMPAPAGRKMTGVWCVNHMKKRKRESDLEGQNQYTVKFRFQRGFEEVLTISGTNMGPPVPPPA